MAASGEWPLIVIGGGAAGVFAAIHFAGDSGAPVLLLEAGSRLLQKVSISGGGRCNLTNAEPDRRRFAAAYPRGEASMRSWLRRFSARDLCRWFEGRGIALKTEVDGRIFPLSDSSQTVIDALQSALVEEAVELRLRSAVQSIAAGNNGYLVQLRNGTALHTAQLIVATGGGRTAAAWASAMGIAVQPLTPSLFSFQIDDPELRSLSGLSAPAALSLPQFNLKARGALLITHRGLSGPAVLRLSAFGARHLQRCGYRARLQIDLAPDSGEQELRARLLELRQSSGGRSLLSIWPTPSARRLREYVWHRSETPLDLRCSQITAAQQTSLIRNIKHMQVQINGKGPFKEEFVCAGGVDLAALDRRWPESLQHPGLYFAGEALDIDGLTGGYNLQAAWTTGYLCAQAAAQRQGSAAKVN
ncbi:MAG: NAD(P)/FAD-dependent oxidoreductase [Leptospirales bacterium]|nr:NAD(P)/FAD-dependent oxidoreductase [Leptospirales bacterium]